MQIKIHLSSSSTCNKRSLDNRKRFVAWLTTMVQFSHNVDIECVIATVIGVHTNNNRNNGCNNSKHIPLLHAATIITCSAPNWRKEPTKNITFVTHLPKTGMRAYIYSGFFCRLVKSEINRIHWLCLYTRNQCSNLFSELAAYGQYVVQIMWVRSPKTSFRGLWHEKEIILCHIKNWINEQCNENRVFFPPSIC